VIYVKGSQTFIPSFVAGKVMPPQVPGAGTFVGWLADLESAALLSRLKTKNAGTLGQAVFSTLATQVLIPVHRGPELEAFVCLGEKRSGDIYTSTDLTLLTTLAKSLSVHLLRFTDAELLEQTREIQEKMRRYVPGALAEEIELGRDLETGEREVSVLFVDIRGFTAYSQSKQAPEVFAAISRYTETCSSIVHEVGGAVVEFNGDGMMAVFGAPRPLEDKEQAAVEAARRMVEDVPATAEGEPLAVGVGVATGPAYVGNIEAVDRMIWSALGRTVNLAARLQAMTRDLNASILLDETTYTRAGQVSVGFVTRPSVSIRGLREVETLFSLDL
jgi:class 3 adenylate cyclase